MEDPSLNQSLEELENRIWQKDNFPTALVEKCFYARKKKLKNLDLDEIRLLITQKIGLKYLVPLAISLLKNDIMIDAGYYEGDLLLAVLTIPSSFWLENIRLRRSCFDIVEGKEQYINNYPDLTDTIKENIINAYSNFKMGVSNN